MASGVVLLADGSSLHIGSHTSNEPAKRLVELTQPVGGLAVSPSGRFGLLRSRLDTWVAVVDLADGTYLASIGDADARPRSAVAAFGTHDGHDVLFISRALYTLEMLSLPEMEPLASARYAVNLPFWFRSLHPVNEEYVVAVGAGESEGYRSFLTVSVPELLADPEAAATEFQRRSRPWDYVSELSAGPCGSDSVVVHRDPMIDPDDPDDPLDDDEPNSDIDNLHGFYVRRLHDGQLIERIPDGAPFPAEADMFATDSVIVAGLTGRVAAVPRSSTGAPEKVEIEAEVYGFDPATHSVVVARADGTVEVFQTG
jgi:hypothetical protein